MARQRQGGYLEKQRRKDSKRLLMKSQKQTSKTKQRIFINHRAAPSLAANAKPSRYIQHPPTTTTGYVVLHFAAQFSGCSSQPQRAQDSQSCSSREGGHEIPDHRGPVRPPHWLPGPLSPSPTLQMQFSCSVPLLSALLIQAEQPTKQADCNETSYVLLIPARAPAINEHAQQTETKRQFHP